MKNIDQGFNTAAQDSNPGSRSRESEALPLSHYALPITGYNSEVYECIQPLPSIRFAALENVDNYEWTLRVMSRGHITTML